MSLTKYVGRCSCFEDTRVKRIRWYRYDWTVMFTNKFCFLSLTPSKFFKATKSLRRRSNHIYLCRELNIIHISEIYNIRLMISIRSLISIKIFKKKKKKKNLRLRKKILTSILKILTSTLISNAWNTFV